MIAQKMSKKDLLALPDADWSAEGEWWESLLIVPLRTKHDSGYANIAIIGVDDKGEAREVLTRGSDDIHLPLAPSGWHDEADLRMDAYHPTGILKLWSRTYQFRVNHPVSTARIEARRSPA